jgi:type I restriction enzyme R subunit
MATEAEQAKAALEVKLAAQQSAAAQVPSAVATVVQAAGAAAQKVELDESATRKLIDQQLKAAGWEADTEQLTYGKGARPEKGKNLAIAEWPTASGPADYVLFAGLTAVATVEAKRKAVDVSAALQQAKRYSRDFTHAGDFGAGGPWDVYRIPFTFATNGRPYLKQLATKSGVWFCDVRRSTNLSRALDGWMTPEGLTTLLKRDEAAAHQQLKEAPFEYGFPLRPYQREAIQAVERGIADGRRELLLAMATGTGKTKTCVALIYRLLKAQRFKRVLFLVDRSALGEQAANAFKDTQMESLQKFADVFGIKELDEVTPDTETAVHLATVQGMVKRVLFPGEDGVAPPVDQYDCIVVDECHRGYLLDRELSDTELTFRGFEDYVSKYRRVIEYFDAVKVGLTATPALHTVEIFGKPVYTYSYREAVVDGYLVDHEPPIQIKTELSQQGITWEKGEEVRAYDPLKHQEDLFTAPDEIHLEIEDFNRKVVTESFNRVVCRELARQIDPKLPAKTLVFCANDAHADLVVQLLKEVLGEQYGEVDDDTVVKITGTADKPLALIRRYKNEALPNIAVTVDLLTTGIDVPEICNLVFLRRVNSRILFDQMLGRGTRLCPEIGKEAFRVFDAVRLYEALGSMTAMQPVVADPKVSFTQLVKELGTVQQPEQRKLVFDQFIAKLQRKKRHLDAQSLQDFETRCGMPPDAFIAKLKAMKLPEVAAWFTQNPDLGEILDRVSGQGSAPVLISDHADTLKAVEHGYGAGRRPEDFLKEFGEFIRAKRNEIAALSAVLTRPRELTRKQLKELRLALDTAGFPEKSLAAAWRDRTNQEIAAGIIGYIRQAALGDALVPYEARVDKALAKILASRAWTAPQREWLKKIAEQTKSNLIVDREALDDPAQLFKSQGGGFGRLNKIFDGELEKVLATFNDELWPPAA